MHVSLNSQCHNAVKIIMTKKTRITDDGMNALQKKKNIME
jgi:hypothetical protein